MNIAVIPARGGSKRIPGKNIKLFAGKPLIAYSIDAAKRSKLFDKVIVSTDSEEIKEIAIEYGAEVPFLRPETLSNDVAGTRVVTNHAIKYFQSIDEAPQYICCIYATAPFLQPDYLVKGLDLLKADPSKAFSFAVTTFPFPILRSLKHTDSGVEPMFPEHINKRSQDLPEAFHDAGQFYWGTVEGYLSNKVIFSDDSVPVVLPRHLVQDIDTHEDWVRAELMYRAYMAEYQ